MMVRICALRLEGHNFESFLPILLVEVSSPHIDPKLCAEQMSLIISCKECLIGPFGASMLNKVYIIIILDR